MKRLVIAALLTLSPAMASAHGIVTVPGEECMISGKHHQKIECIINNSSKYRTVYTQTNPGGAGNYGLSHLTTSLNAHYLIFIAPGGAVAGSGQIMRLNLRTDKASYITNGSLECVVREGQYAGDAVVWKIVGYGSDFDPFLYSLAGHRIGLIEVPPKAEKCYRYGTNVMTAGVYTGNHHHSAGAGTRTKQAQD